ncbi:MAG: pyridoxal-dependent decarboxylase [Gemmatimonadota bacterium]
MRDTGHGRATTTAQRQAAAAEGQAATAEVLRQEGSRLVERMAAYLDDLEAGPVSTRHTAAELATRFDLPLPRTGLPAREVWDEVWRDVVADAIHLAHPMYLGHQVAPPLPHAVLADALASLLNQSVAVWEMSPTGTPLERRVVAWMKELIGYPKAADGTTVSGGSAANLTGLLAAREARFPGAWRRGVAGTPGLERAVVLTGAHTHYSVERAVGVMGMGADAVVSVPERELRMDVAALERILAELAAADRTPLAIVATAASTATGLFDDLDAIADVAEAHGIWLHVDGAHGASFVLSPALRDRLKGIERADSLSWDPHKMLFMPISAGMVLVRDGAHLASAFQQSAPYLFHPRPGETRTRDMGQHTLQCSRRLDALKLWICLRHYGVEHFSGLLEHTVANAAALHALLEAAPDFEAVHAPESNILCFRYLPDGSGTWEPERVDALQGTLRERYNAVGGGWITTTVLGGRRVLRVTLMNPATEQRHLEAMLEGLRETAARIATTTRQSDS